MHDVCRTYNYFYTHSHLELSHFLPKSRISKLKELRIDQAEEQRAIRFYAKLSRSIINTV